MLPRRPRSPPPALPARWTSIPPGVHCCVGLVATSTCCWLVAAVCMGCPALPAAAAADGRRRCGRCCGCCQWWWCWWCWSGAPPACNPMAPCMPDAGCEDRSVKHSTLSFIPHHGRWGAHRCSRAATGGAAACRWAHLPWRKVRSAVLHVAACTQLQPCAHCLHACTHARVHMLLGAGLWGGCGRRLSRTPVLHGIPAQNGAWATAGQAPSRWPTRAQAPAQAASRGPVRPPHHRHPVAGVLCAYVRACMGRRRAESAWVVSTVTQPQRPCPYHACVQSVLAPAWVTTRRIVSKHLRTPQPPRSLARPPLMGCPTLRPRT